MGLSLPSGVRIFRTHALACVLALILTVLACAAVPCLAQAEEQPSQQKYEVGTEEDLDDCVIIASSEGGTIVLTRDIVLTKRLVIPSRHEVRMDLKGHTLSRTLDHMEADGNVILVESGAKLDIVDTSPKGSGKIKGGRANDGGGIYNRGTLNLTGGTVVDCEARYCGGGIHNSGTMTITSTWIEKCKAEGGGGIYNQGVASVGAKNIQDNTATDIGGGILNDSQMTLTRVTVRRNNARTAGGIASRIVSFTDITTLDVSGCTVTANTASFLAGGIYGTRYIWDWSTEAKGTQHKGKVTIGGNTKITNNTSSTAGGVIADYGTSLALEGATITGNVSETGWFTGMPASGGVTFNGKANSAHSEPTADFTIEGKNIIKNNKCAGAEGNLAMAPYDTMQVTGPFTSGTSIGLTSHVFPIWEFTTDYSLFNDKPASSYFFNKQNLSVKDRGGEAAFVEPVPYIDEEGAPQVTDEYSLADGSQTTLLDGTYVSYRNAKVSERLYCQGDVWLILRDGTKLELPRGLEIQGGTDGKTLTNLHILGQEKGTGKLECEGESGKAGLAFNEKSSVYLHVYAGDIMAIGGKGAAGIGTGSAETEVCIATMYVHGGHIIATGGSKGAGIGSGSSGGCNLNYIIYGGEVTATGNGGAAGIGGAPKKYASVSASFLGGVTYASSGYEGAAAVGVGVSGTDNAKYGFGSYMTVNAAGGNQPAAERWQALRQNSIAIIEPCTHMGEAYTLIDAKTHKVSCLYCVMEKRVEGHRIGPDHTCPCGYKTPTHTLTYDPAGGKGQMIVSDPIYEGETVALANYDIWQPNGYPPSGKFFKYWEVDGERMEPGDVLVMDSDKCAKAIWDVACRVSFRAGEGRGKFGPLIRAKGTDLTLPECTFEGPQGKGFAGWLKAGELFSPGDVVEVTGNLDFTATYGMSWTMLQAAMDASSGETIRLTNDVRATEADAALVVAAGKSVTIDLCGHAIDRHLLVPTTDGYCMLVRGSLTLCDSSADGSGRVTGANNANIRRGRGDELVGGGVCVDGGTLTLEGGGICGNASTNGAGVLLVRSGSVFCMSAGSVSENVAGDFGGGVYVSHGSTFSIAGGAICDNSVPSPETGFEGQAGAGIYAVSTIEMEGSPTISGNTCADAVASNVYLASSSQRVRITGDFTPTVPVGITTRDPRPVTYITEGLATHGRVTDFVADDPNQVVAPDGDEAVMRRPNTLTFDAGGEDVDGTMEPRPMAYGLAFTLPDCDFVSRDHRAFRAWSIEGREYEAGTDYMPHGNVTAYATWDDTYEVTFDAGEGTGEAEPAYVVCDHTYALPKTCPFEPPVGGTFLGWEVKGRLCEPATEIVVDEPLTVKAVWDLTWAGLQALLDSAGDVSVTLPHDIRATASDGPLTIAEPKQVEIDLNGHALDRAGAVASAQGDPIRVQADKAGAVFDIAADGISLTIRDGAGGGVVCGAQGSAVFAGDGRAQISLEGVDVSGNEVTDGICDVAGSLRIERASVHDNRGVTCGGIHVGACSVTLGADARIHGNTAAGAPSNVRLASGATIEVEGLVGEVEPLGISSDETPSAQAPVRLTSGLFGYGDEFSFACEEGPYLVAIAEDEAWLVVPVHVTIEPAGGVGEMLVDPLPIGMRYPLPECTLTPPAGKAFACWLCDLNDGSGPRELAPETEVMLYGDVTLTASWKDHEHVLSLVEAKAPTCTEAGHIAHWACTAPDGGCGRLFADEAGQRELTAEEVALAATGHTAAEPVRENEVEATGDAPASWDEVTYCSVCGKEMGRVHRVEGEDSHVCEPGEPVRTDEVPATCEEGGSYIEVVTCTVCGKELSRERRLTEPCGHMWSEPAYEWGENLDTVTATRTCLRDPSHVETETVETEPYPKAFEDSSMELVTFTATFANPAFGVVSRQKMVDSAGEETDKDDGKTDSGDKGDADSQDNGQQGGWGPEGAGSWPYEPSLRGRPYVIPRADVPAYSYVVPRTYSTGDDSADRGESGSSSTSGSAQGAQQTADAAHAPSITPLTPVTTQVTAPSDAGTAAPSTPAPSTAQVQVPSTGQARTVQTAPAAPTAQGGEDESVGAPEVTSAPLSATSDVTCGAGALAAGGSLAVGCAVASRLRRRQGRSR